VNQPIPVLRYAGEKPPRPAGIISLTLRIVAAIIVMAYGIVATAGAIYLIYDWLWLRGASWKETLLRFEISGVLGVASLLAAAHIFIQVWKELNRRRYQKEKEPNRAPW
jgi:hypothetical protein